MINRFRSRPRVTERVFDDLSAATIDLRGPRSVQRSRRANDRFNGKFFPTRLKRYRDHEERSSWFICEPAAQCRNERDR